MLLRKGPRVPDKAAVREQILSKNVKALTAYRLREAKEPSKPVWQQLYEEIRENSSLR
jgi:hypothetical protein